MYLIDVDVLSELRKRKRDPNVVAWFEAMAPTDLFVCTITIGGIERQRTINPGFAQALANWLDVTLRAYGERVLPLTVGIARRWARLAAKRGNKQRDLAIAATALEHGLIVVTRKVSDFQPTGVPIFNPFNPQPRRKA
jgi:toxin FitB